MQKTQNFREDVEIYQGMRTFPKTSAPDYDHINRPP